MKHCIFALVLLGLLAACGGGGTGTPTLEPNPDPVPAPSPQQVVDDVLADCGLAGLEDALADLGNLGGVLDPATSGSTAVLQVTGGSLADARIDWSLDLEGDGAVDVTGSVRFRNAAGQPTIPFDLATFGLLLTGSADATTLADLAASFPDGTHVVVSFNRPAPPPAASGLVDVVYVGGQPQSADGTVVLTQTDGCVSTVSFADVPVAPLLVGAWPTAVLDVTLETGSHVLDGTFTLDGTTLAVLELTLDGGVQTFVYDVDLTTWTATPRP